MVLCLDRMFGTERNTTRPDVTGKCIYCVVQELEPVVRRYCDRIDSTVLLADLHSISRDLTDIGSAHDPESNRNWL